MRIPRKAKYFWLYVLPGAAVVALSVALGDVVYQYTHSTLDQFMFTFGFTFYFLNLLFILREIWFDMISLDTLIRLFEVMLKIPKSKAKKDGKMPKVPKQ